MDKKLLQKAFREAKKEAQLDYAITVADSLGDCCSCVNAALADKYGEESKGIFLKYWRYGMNAQIPIEEQRYNYICHDLTTEQAHKVVNVLKKYFNIEWDFNDAHCIKISG